jgi:serine protease
MSLGGQQSCSATMQAAIDKARNLGAMVVVSAGNSNLNASGFEPASCKGVISVAATNRNGAKAAYSNFGASVFIAAPGGDGAVDPGVLSLSNTGTTTPNMDSTRWLQGTSMAAPHVSGVAALMLGANGLLPMSSLASILQATSRPFPGTCSQCGTGIVDATKAVQSAIAFTPEHEPNNTMGTAQVLTVSPADVYGAINDGNSDNDHYLLPLPAGQTLTAILDNRGTIDMNLYFYNSNTGQVLGGSATPIGGADEKITYVNTSGKQMWITLRVLRGAGAPAGNGAQKYKLMVKKS